MKIYKKLFNQLELGELYDILRLRNRVFIVEQNCPYEDIDGEDRDAHHIFIIEDEIIVAYTRVLILEDKLYIGRVIVDRDYRGRGIAKKLMDESIEYAFSSFKYKEIFIEAQVYLIEFYKGLGFERISEDFILDDILHCKMKLDNSL